MHVRSRERPQLARKIPIPGVLRHERDRKMLAAA
jgi:hypothetical protein